MKRTTRTSIPGGKLLTTLFIIAVNFCALSQYSYEIRVYPNDSLKDKLSLLTSNIQFSSRHVIDSTLRISSNYNLDDQYFENIADQNNFIITSFEKSSRTIDNSSSGNQEKACCSIILDMYDSYGDGWNGGYLTVTIDGVSTNYSTSGSYTQATVPYCDGQLLEISWTPGFYADEVTYAISSSAGTLLTTLYTNASGEPSTGTIFLSNNACSSTNSTPTNQDCEGAQMVCNNNSFSGNSFGGGTNADLSPSTDGCLSGEYQSSWYYVNIGTGGTLEMTIDPDNYSDDYDFAIWGPFDETTANANCPPTTSPVRCSYALDDNTTGMVIGESGTSESQFGDGWVSPLNTSDGDIYILLIDNYSGSSQPFDLTWGGSAGLDCTTVPLPVELISFTGQNQGNQNNISWTTLSEKNNDYFTLQYSKDGINWENIGDVNGAGTTSEKQYYSFTHRDFEIGINYYRLIQVDFDGSKSKHEIISINNSNDSEVIKILNTLGQEVDDSYKGIIIVYYKNGTIRKYFNN